MRNADPDAFRAVMSRFAAGVTVMTTVTRGGPHGMTANAIASVSLDPLLVLVCVERGTVMARAVAESGVFALSILSGEQERLSNHFADGERPEGEPMFAAAPYDWSPGGAPLLRDALAWVDCRVWATYPGGDHDIVVGEVTGVDLGHDADALVYYRSGYVPLPAPNPATH